MKHLKSNSGPVHSLSMEEMLAYVNGELSESDVKRVDKLLQNSPIYKDAINELRTAMNEDANNQAKIASMEAAMESEIAHLGAKYAQQQAKNKSSFSLESLIPSFGGAIFSGEGFVWDRRMQLQAAIGVLFLLVVSYSLYLWLRPPLEIRIADRYLSHYEDPNKVLDDMREIAVKYYYDQNYDAAIPLFRQILNEQQADGNPNQIRIFLAVSLLQTKRASEAEPFLKEVIKHGNNIYISAARWYLGLCYLYKQDIAEAVSQFRILVETGRQDKESRRFTQMAREILQQLE